MPARGIWVPVLIIHICSHIAHYPQDVLAENDVHILINAHVEAYNHVSLIEGWMIMT